MAAFEKTSGLILREVNYKEADKILTVLTADMGKLTVSARGARRKNSRTGAATQFLAYSEMSLFENKGRWSVNEAEPVELFPGLRQDVVRLALGAYMAELLEAVSDEDSLSPELLPLGLNALYAAASGREPALVKGAFELRLMCLSGYAPDLSGCAACGKENPEEPRLDLSAGSLRCRACKGQEKGIAMPLNAGALAAMRHVLGAPARRFLSFQLAEGSLKPFAAACEAYVLTQLERSFRTLDFYKQMVNVQV